MDDLLERLKRALRLDPETGQLYRRTPRSNAMTPGGLAGCENGKGYRRVRVGNDRFLVHRVVYALANDVWPTEQVDHINLDKTDNRPSNLRLATAFQNSQNIGVPAHNTSGVKGVSWNTNRRKWAAQINLAGKRAFLGYFGTIDEAAEAYRQASLEHYGEFARSA